LRPTATIATALLALSLHAHAAAGTPKPDPIEPVLGVWKWESPTPNGDTLDSTLNLSVTDGVLKGVVTARGMDSPATEIEFQNDTLRFKVVRERNKQKTYALYQGHFDGKILRGEFESNFGGQKRTRAWEAMREADFAARPPNLNGSWRYTFPGHSGQSFEPVLKLKQEGSTLTGSLQFNENSTAVTEGHLDGTNVWIKIVRSRDGKDFTSIYKGSVAGANIQGTIEVDWTGVPQTYPWQARHERR